MLDMCGSSGGPSGLELIIDSFAGGGGASTGIRMALGRDPDAALNHNPVALAIHRANHPGSVHYCQDIFSVEPNHVTRGRPVGLLWASPDCTHFSKAKGAAPKRDAKIRDLAWAVVKWAKQARPRVIILENVEEFVTWGPLDEKGEIIKARQGETFKQWLRELRRLGYKVEHRELRACDYGAPTIRKRFFLIARRDGRPIVWPKPTHGPGRPQPYRTAADIIDWSLPCPSIFERKRPLAENTLRRIAEGIRRYVIEAAEPFIVPIEHYNGRVRVQPVGDSRGGGQGCGVMQYPAYTRNRRSVWTIATTPFPEAHFATFPPALVEPCLKAGCPVGGVVLDPFLGSGTVGLVARRLGRSFVGIDLNPDYCAMAQRRIERDSGLFGPVPIVAAPAETRNQEEMAS